MNFYLLKWAKSVIFCGKGRDSFPTSHCGKKKISISLPSWGKGNFFGGFPFSHVGREEIVFPFPFSTATLWEAKNSQSIIDLILMSDELINKIKHCKTKSKINQSFDHISIFTKLLLKIITISIIFRRLWRSINVEKIKEMKKNSLIKNSKTKSQINKNTKK